MDWNIDRVRSLAQRGGVHAIDLTAPISRSIDGPEGRLHVLDWPGDGPPVLLLHGGALTARTWDMVCLALRTDHRLVAMDLRGHGDSHWSNRYDLGDHVRDVTCVLDAIGLDRCHFVGMSLGGVVAAMTAEAHPARCSSLALIDVAPGVDFAATRGLRTFISGVVEADSIGDVVDAALRLSPRSDRERVAYRMETLLRETPDGRWRWKYDRRSPPDYPAILAKVERLDHIAAAAGVPVLLVRGGRSRVLGRPAARRFMSGVLGARLIMAPNAGHNVQEDNPASLARALRGFWQSL